MYDIDYENDFCETTVNRSKALKCSICEKHLPMNTAVVFELKQGKFQGVFCMKCVETDDDLQYALAYHRHPFDLDD